MRTAFFKILIQYQRDGIDPKNSSNHQCLESCGLTHVDHVYEARIVNTRIYEARKALRASRYSI